LPGTRWAAKNEKKRNLWDWKDEPVVGRLKPGFSYRIKNCVKKKGLVLNWGSKPSIPER